MKWAIDAYHTSVTFTVRHMMSRVRGEMKLKEGWIDTDSDNLSKARVEVVLDPGTINTGVEMRDNHLRSADVTLTSRIIRRLPSRARGSKVRTRLTSRSSAI